MKKGRLKKTLRIAIWAFVVFAILGVFTSEYQGKWALKREVKEGMPIEELFKLHGDPNYTYQGWEALPDAYRDLFEQALDDEDVYYSYQKEGLPRYWSFVVSANSETRTIKRYVIWKAGAITPRKLEASVEEVILSFRESVTTDLEERNASVIMDTILQPNEERKLGALVKAKSVGYFVDSQFKLKQAGGFVRIYGSGGSESGVSDHVEIRHSGGELKETFRLVNEGKEPRRVLVYVTY